MTIPHPHALVDLPFIYHFLLAGIGDTARLTESLWVACGGAPWSWKQEDAIYKVRSVITRFSRKPRNIKAVVALIL